jgi:hypothetical protein
MEASGGKMDYGRDGKGGRERRRTIMLRLAVRKWRFVRGRFGCCVRAGMLILALLCRVVGRKRDKGEEEGNGGGADKI